MKNIGIILAIISLVVLGWNLLQVNKPNTSMEYSQNIKDFIWEDKKISFQYPEFENWGVKEVSQKSENEYTIFLNYPLGIDFEIIPQIKIAIVPEWSLKALRLKKGYITQKKNAMGVLYDTIQVQHNPKMLAFFTEDFGVTITPISISKEYGFYEDVFFEKIINTFTIKH